MLVVPVTRAGVINLTPKMVYAILSEPEERVFSLSAVDATECQTALQELFKRKQTSGGTSADDMQKKGFFEYCGLQGPTNNDVAPTLFLTTRSPFVGNHTSGPTSEAGITADVESGRVTITVPLLQQLANWTGADYVATLCDCPSLNDVPQKKRRTAVERSEKWKDAMLQQAVMGNRDVTTTDASKEATTADGGVSTSVPSSSSSSASPAPTSKKRARTETAVEAPSSADSPQSLLLLSIVPHSKAGGVAVSASAAAVPSLFSGIGGVIVPAVNQHESLGARLQFLSETANHNNRSTSSSAVVFCQAESIVSMILSVAAGATHVECALPWLLSEKGIALNIPAAILKFAVEKKDAAASSIPVLEEDPSRVDGLYLNCHDPVYQRQTIPLSSSCCCGCITCQRHTRAYLYHLLTVQEMNSEIYLTAHNLWQCAAVMRGLRRAMRQGRMNEFVNLVVETFSMK